MRNGCADRLAREGSDLSFEDAMDCYEGQVEEELRVEVNGDLTLAEQIELNTYGEEMLAAALIARSIYAQAGGDEEWAAQVMQEHENEGVRAIGEALETGDYSTLGI